MKHVAVALVFLPLALFFWAFITLLFATGLAATAACLWLDDGFERLHSRFSSPPAHRPPAAS